MNNLISVIIPVYNVEKYLERCVKSVQGQTYANLEIILVDDGSPDKCGEMCDKFAKDDPRIKVIHKENGGLSDARNVGIDSAAGKYLTFIDSDDYVAKNYVEALYSALIWANADISQVEHEKFFDEDQYDASARPSSGELRFTQKEAIKDMLLYRSLSASAWGKLYRAELFDKIRFPVGKLYEDFAIAFEMLLQVGSVVYVDAPLYKYYIREGSIMQRPFDMRQYVEIEFIERSMALVEAAYPELHTEICVCRLYSYFRTLHRIMRSKNRREFRPQQDEMVRKIRQYSKGLLSKKQVNRNLKIKVVSMYFGRYAYYFVQSISDLRKQIKAGRRYYV